MAKTFFLGNQILWRRCLSGKMDQKLSQQKNPEINSIKTTWLSKKCHLSNLLQKERFCSSNIKFTFRNWALISVTKLPFVCLSAEFAKSFHNDWWIQRFLFDFEKLDLSLWFQYWTSCAAEVSLSCKSISKLSFQTFPY